MALAPPRPSSERNYRSHLISQRNTSSSVWNEFVEKLKSKLQSQASSHSWCHWLMRGPDRLGHIVFSQRCHSRQRLTCSPINEVKRVHRLRLGTQVWINWEFLFQSIDTRRAVLCGFTFRFSFACFDLKYLFFCSFLSPWIEYLDLHQKVLNS